MVLSTMSHHCETLTMPDLLAGLTGRTGKVVLAYREKISDTAKPGAVSSNLHTAHQARDGDQEEDLDLTGSPLGADFDLEQEWDVSCPGVETEQVTRSSGPRYTGLALAQARAWLGETSPGERWAVTGGEDKERTCYLGRREEAGLVTVSRVTSRPPDSHRAVSGELGRVMSLHRRAGAGPRTVRQEVGAEYCLVGGAGTDTTSLTLSSTWTKVSSLLEPPPLYADTKVQVRIVGGDEKLATSQLWSELQLLAGFVRGLSGEGVTWLGSEEDQDVETIVQDLLETVRQTGPRTGVTKMEAETVVEQEAEPFSLKERQEVDFTDLVWTSLYRVTSYHQLTEAFKLLFTRIMTEEIRPFVYARNKSNVVKIVNSLVRGGESLPDLSGYLPLELLIECGLEKLKRDYSHTLLNSKLASKENISQFLVSDNHSGAVQSLYSLHIVVELAFLLQTFLSLSPDVLRSLVGSALSDPVSSQGGGSTREFNFSVPTQALQQLGELRPDIWTLRLSTGKSGTLNYEGLSLNFRYDRQQSGEGGGDGRQGEPGARGRGGEGDQVRDVHL